MNFFYNVFFRKCQQFFVNRRLWISLQRYLIIKNKSILILENKILVSGNKNPCQNGNPLTDSNGEIIICGGTEQCPSDEWFCHVGGSPETTNCCSLSGTNACNLPLKYGYGTERLERWYYDSKVTKICKQFIYSGLKGNANNFLSRDACKSTCPGKFFLKTFYWIF